MNQIRLYRAVIVDIPFLPEMLELVVSKGGDETLLLHWLGTSLEEMTVLSYAHYNLNVMSRLIDLDPKMEGFKRIIYEATIVNVRKCIPADAVVTLERLDNTAVVIKSTLPF